MREVHFSVSRTKIGSGCRHGVQLIRTAGKELGPHEQLQRKAVGWTTAGAIHLFDTEAVEPVIFRKALLIK